MSCAHSFAEAYEQRHVIVDKSTTVFGSTSVPLSKLAGELVATLSDPNVSALVVSEASLNRHNTQSRSPLHSMLQPGTHQWPFRVSLPRDYLPPDYVSKYGSHISYSLTAKVHIPFGTVPCGWPCAG